ncbi:MAG: hypothetical protein ACPGSM_06230 [Thiolinea sp.]
MKKIISRALVAGVIAFGMMTQVSAGHLSHIVDEANHLRATSNSLNYKASKIEDLIRYKQAHGYNPVYLKHKAQKLRKKAKRLAQKSNYVAKSAFNHGYHRHGHSHVHSSHYGHYH